MNDADRLPYALGCLLMRDGFALSLTLDGAPYEGISDADIAAALGIQLEAPGEASDG